MNIKKAKEEIKNTILAYLRKDEFGDYRIPPSNQRPIFIVGPPGVGKTAIMEQVARECKIGIVSYTITHHTRQSAIGLPYIEKQSYGGREYSFTEYTMSEIVASVYKKMEETNLKEGILFIDEINCVSETLSATMLQFLKEKAFGNHKVPRGWIICTAGNPPEYNKSVREFDMVTMDRLRKINIREDYKTWKEYAYLQMVHPSIISYLDIKKEHFYVVETKVDGKEFVTARGWEDLSKMLITYEELNLSVEEDLIYQYLQHQRIAKDFSNYYDFYLKYKSEYSVHDILNGIRNETTMKKILEAPFDERLTFLGLLLGKLYEYFKAVMENDLYMNGLFEGLKDLRIGFENDSRSLETTFEEVIEDKYKELGLSLISNHMDKSMELSLRKVLHTLNEYKVRLKHLGIVNKEEGFEKIKESFSKEKEDREVGISYASIALKNAFLFVEEVFSESQEMVIFITELTMNYYSNKFIGDYGSEEYYRYNKEILYKDKRGQLLAEIKDLML